MQLLASEFGAAYYYTRPPGIVSLLVLTIIYIKAISLHVDTQHRFNNYAVHSLYRILVTATGVMRVMKMGNIVPRAGLEPTSLAFRASVPPLHHVGFPGVTTTPTPTCLCSSLPQRSEQTATLLWMDTA